MSDGDPNVDLVCVFESDNPALLPVVESLLQDAGIDFMTRNDALQDLFAAGRLGGSVTGPATIWVREDDAAEARELIAGLGEAEAPPGDEP